MTCKCYSHWAPYSTRCLSDTRWIRCQNICDSHAELLLITQSISLSVSLSLSLSLSLYIYIYIYIYILLQVWEIEAVLVVHLWCRSDGVTYSVERSVVTRRRWSRISNSRWTSSGDTRLQSGTVLRYYAAGRACHTRQHSQHHRVPKWRRTVARGQHLLYLFVNFMLFLTVSSLYRDVTCVPYV